jgi:hypothetical protein
MAPAPTIRLATSAPPTAAAPGATTAPGARPPGVGSPTIALPKATVQLQPPTQPLGTSFPATQVGTLAAAEEEEETETNEGIINILSIVGFVAALVVLTLQLMTASTWINAEDNQNKGQWSQLME